MKLKVTYSFARIFSALQPKDLLTMNPKLINKEMAATRLLPISSQEIITLLRGKRSPAAFSKYLGFSFNQVYLWESGRRKVYWEDFQEICETAKIPFSKLLYQYFHYEGPKEFHQFLNFTFKVNKKQDLAKKLNVSTSKLSRWMNGRSPVPLDKALLLLQLGHLNAIDFLDEVLGAGKLQSIQNFLSGRAKMRSVYLDIPYSMAVAPALQLKGYKDLPKHDDAFIAKEAGISVQEVKIALRALLEAGMIERDGEKYRFLPIALNLGTERERFAGASRYWNEFGVKMQNTGTKRSGFGYRVFAVTEEGYAKIKEATMTYYSAISKILENENEPFDHVIAINFQVLFLNEVQLRKP